MSNGVRTGIAQRWASRLRYPQLFLLAGGLFLLDLIVPDLIPFADEILLGLLTALIGSLRARRGPEYEEPREKNITPPKN
jgi:hypothetical protein